MTFLASQYIRDEVSFDVASNMPANIPPRSINHTVTSITKYAHVCRVPSPSSISSYQRDSQSEIDEAVPPSTVTTSKNVANSGEYSAVLRELAAALLGDPNDEHRLFHHMRYLYKRSKTLPGSFEDDLKQINAEIKASRIYKGLQLKGVDEQFHSVIVEFKSRPSRQVVQRRLSTLLKPAKLCLYEAPVDNKGDPLNRDSTEEKCKIVKDVHLVKQGSIGDCYFLASACALAAKHPESIVNMIHDNHNGTYSVSFPGLGGEVITVAATTYGDTQFFVQNGRSSWLNVLEKAHRQLTRTELIDKGGAPDSVMKLLTNKAAKRYRIQAMTNTLTELDYLLEDSSKQQKLVVCDSKVRFNNRPMESAGGKLAVLNYRGEQRTIYMPAPHAFNVVAYVRDSHLGDSQIVLQNPWGFNNSLSGKRTTGQMTVALRDFAHFFYSLYIGDI